MNWLTTTLKLSVCKKMLMAISGLFFCCFLIIHLGGNLTIYLGKEVFNKYINHIHSLEFLITLFEACLIFLGGIHVFIAINIFITNRKARPVKYAIRNRSSNKSIISTTMPYTGSFILIFVLFHLFNFNLENVKSLSTFSIIQYIFSNFCYVCFYTLSIFAVSLHVSHGIFSAFQTIGINHKKYNKLIEIGSYIISIFILMGFGFIPMYVVLANI